MHPESCGGALDEGRMGKELGAGDQRDLPPISGLQLLGSKEMGRLRFEPLSVFSAASRESWKRERVRGRGGRQAASWGPGSAQTVRLGPGALHGPIPLLEAQGPLAAAGCPLSPATPCSRNSQSDLGVKEMVTVTSPLSPPPSPDPTYPGVGLLPPSSAPGPSHRP